MSTKVTDTKVVTGAPRLAKRIATIRAGLGVAMFKEELAQLLLRRTLDRFDKEVDPDNQAWKPLKNKTKADKRRLGYGGILKRTLLLRNSISIIRGNAEGTMYTNTGAGIRIGVRGPAADYGRYHQHGTPKMVQRRFLGVGELDIKSVDSFLRRRADKVIGES